MPRERNSRFGNLSYHNTRLSAVKQTVLGLRAPPAPAALIAPACGETLSLAQLHARLLLVPQPLANKPARLFGCLTSDTAGLPLHPATVKLFGIPLAVP